MLVNARPQCGAMVCLLGSVIKQHMVSDHQVRSIELPTQVSCIEQMVDIVGMFLVLRVLSMVDHPHRQLLTLQTVLRVGDRCEV